MKIKRDKGVSAEDQTWGLERVTPIIIRELTILGRERQPRQCKKHMFSVGLRKATQNLVGDVGDLSSNWLRYFA